MMWARKTEWWKNNDIYIQHNKDERRTMIYIHHNNKERALSIKKSIIYSITIKMRDEKCCIRDRRRNIKFIQHNNWEWWKNIKCLPHYWDERIKTLNLYNPTTEIKKENIIFTHHTSTDKKTLCSKTEKVMENRKFTNKKRIHYKYIIQQDRKGNGKHEIYTTMTEENKSNQRRQHSNKAKTRNLNNKTETWNLQRNIFITMNMQLDTLSLQPPWQITRTNLW